MNFPARVTGHELVVKDELEWLKVKMKGGTGTKVEMLVPREDRAKYPLGASAIIDFSVKQLDLDLADPAETTARARRN